MNWPNRTLHLPMPSDLDVESALQKASESLLCSDDSRTEE
jgi:hypothetical protein